MKNWIVIVLGLVIVNVIIVDVLIAKLWQKSKIVETKKIVETNNVSPSPEPTEIIPSPTSESIKTMIVNNKKARSTTIIAISGSGSTNENKWKDLAGTEFNLDTTDYPYFKESYLEVTMRLFNGNGTAFVRLFDVTAGIEVWGSEVKTNNQTFTVITSEKLRFRPGNHLYRIQAKSLTADTVIYNSGRIKIVSEN